MNLLDYSPKLVPLLIMRILKKQDGRALSVNEIIELMRGSFHGNKRPDRRSIYDSIQMIYATGWPIGEHRGGRKQRTYYWRKRVDSNQ